MTWIGTKGSLPQGLDPLQGQKTDPYEPPAPKDWVAGIRNGKQPSYNFAYAGPLTEAFQLGDIALRVGHRIEWDALAFLITNYREANQYLRRQQYRRGFDLKEIVGSAFNV